MAYRYDTYCGLYCGACTVLRANELGTLEQTAERWGTETADLRCHGCKSDVRSVYCRDCSIRSCAVSRGVEFCFACDEYPCAQLAAFRNDRYAHHSIVLRNLEFIRAHGLDAWLEEQAARWRCPTCGTRFVWYDETCGACGAAVQSCVDEERELEI